MGQNSSRTRSPSQMPVMSSEENSATTFPSSSTSSPIVENPINRVRHTSDTSGSRRSSVRKSILNLVKPSSIRSRVTSVASTPGDLGRSWRSSRRWSKAPVNSAIPFDEAEPSSSPLIGVPLAGPSSPDKGKQPEAHAPLEEDEDDEEDSYHEAPEEPQTGLAHNQSFTDIDEDSEPPCVDPEPVLTVEPPAEQIIEGSSAGNTTSPLSEPMAPEPTSNSPPTPRPQTVPLPPRQFPPPGTLVIVQGVVHTTDISRTAPQHEAPSQSASNHPDVLDEPERNRTRNRLSALLRPQSSSRHSSTVFNEVSSSPTDSSEGESPSPDTDGSRSLSEETVLTTPSLDGNVDSFSHDPQPRPPQEPASSPSDNHPPSISSSSIDVLGTLLSVAAAATAASLLTGSSEPILSSGLAPSPPTPNPATSMTSPVSPPQPRPNPDVSAAGRAERMRQAWVTIRERLGLRQSAQDAQTATTNEGANTASADARELMLAEMARAFNIGLGLSGTNTESGTAGAQADSEAVGGSNQNENHEVVNPSTPESNPRTPPTQSTSAPEGSFERFLVDLQVDLRNALTHVEDIVSNSSEAEPIRSDNGPAPSTADASGQHSLSQPTSPTVTPSSDAFNEDDFDTRSNETFEEFGSDRDEDVYDDEDFHSVDHGSIRVDQHSDSSHSRNENGSTSSGRGRIDAAGRINWWRLYRFPAITSAPDSSLRTRQTSTQAEVTPAYAHSATPVESEVISPVDPSTNSSHSPNSSSTGASSPQASPANSSPAPTSSIRSVVPVIIVGLQSVNAQWIPPQPDTDTPASSGETASEFNQNGLGNDRDFGGSNIGIDPAALEGETRGVGRTRGWQSRAAHALRNLRPGRRNAESETADPQNASASNGSRTFLIYVIGGYYPPDHNIVTGGPTNFDSFEALLELADLLGQAKPPTVSKDDIEKSDLQVIKASGLPKHFEEGKVIANCVDRCLICLEEYKPEEDLRLMHCRHAFHKQCVDHWMQTGRNNCPACRSTGVSTEPRNPEAVAA